MSSERSRLHWAGTGLAVLLAAVVMLPVLGHRTLTAWDEAIYAEVSREMLGREWLVPFWNGQPWFEKPPFMLWVTAAFFKLFAVNEFWARAGSAFSGIAIVGLLHGWVQRRQDRLTAWLGAVILLSTFGFLHAGSTGELDLLLSLGCVVALVGLAEVDRGSARGWYGFWIGFALAVMTKGAAAVTLALTLAVFLSGSWRSVRRSFWFGFGLFVALALPWHMYMAHRFGMAFVREYLGFHVLARATGQIEGHVTPWWFYGKVLLADAAPWVVVYPFAAVWGWRRPGMRVFTIFGLAVLIFFSLVQTRLPQYVVPVYAALAVLTANWVATKARDLGFSGKSRAFRIGIVAAVMVVYAASAVLTIPARRHLHEARLANGTVVPRDRELVALLREVMPRKVSIGGPLLLWRDLPRQSIAPIVFYAERPVQQVQSESLDAGAAVRYTSDPKLLNQAIGSEPRLILLDRNLIRTIPAEFVYQPIKTGARLEIGSIRRAIDGPK